MSDQPQTSDAPPHDPRHLIAHATAPGAITVAPTAIPPASPASPTASVRADPGIGSPDHASGDRDSEAGRRVQRIRQSIEAIRPTLQRDRGDIELIDVDGKDVFVRMTGACCGCQLATLTLGGIQKRICDDLGERVRVLPTRPRMRPA
jgi:NifU-like protein